MKNNPAECVRLWEKGFTLIEILLVVAIVGILVSLVAPRLAGRSEEARRQAARADIDGGINLALDLYEVDNGRYPARLEDLIIRPEDTERWKGPYIKKIPRDPWGNLYVYRFPGSDNKETFDLFSPGPDHRADTPDDVADRETGVRTEADVGIY